MNDPQPFVRQQARTRMPQHGEQVDAPRFEQLQLVQELNGAQRICERHH